MPQWSGVLASFLEGVILLKEVLKQFDRCIPTILSVSSLLRLRMDSESS